MDAGGARLLREPRDRLLDVAPDRHHEVGELVDDDDDARQVLVHERLRRRAAARARTGSPPSSSPSSGSVSSITPASLLGLLGRDRLVVAVDVADALVLSRR